MAILKYNGLLNVNGHNNSYQSNGAQTNSLSNTNINHQKNIQNVNANVANGNEHNQQPNTNTNSNNHIKSSNINANIIVHKGTICNNKSLHNKNNFSNNLLNINPN